MKTFEAESLGIDRKSQGATDDAEKQCTLGSKIFTQQQEKDLALAMGALQVACCLWMLVLHYRSWFEPQGSVLYNTFSV